MYREKLIGNSMALMEAGRSVLLVVAMVDRTFQGHLWTLFALAHLAVSEHGNMC